MTHNLTEAEVTAFVVALQSLQGDGRHEAIVRVVEAVVGDLANRDQQTRNAMRISNELNLMEGSVQGRGVAAHRPSMGRASIDNDLLARCHALEAEARGYRADSAELRRLTVQLSDRLEVALAENKALKGIDGGRGRQPYAHTCAKGDAKQVDWRPTRSSISSREGAEARDKRQGSTTDRGFGELSRQNSRAGSQAGSKAGSVVGSNHGSAGGRGSLHGSTVGRGSAHESDVTVSKKSQSLTEHPKKKGSDGEPRRFTKD
eukprot:GHVN01013803.1.p2 GENE.GHVN01013803.1~~GHVN01013803.1.p2  ORF type:complete len:260 (+),score=36.78 GHVN01013803.1:1602-2381(+)